MSDVATLAEGVNLLWVLVASFLIFFMKAGFAMLEAGQVRAKNVANQLTQTLLTLIVGIAAYFAVGAALAAIVGGATGGAGFDIGGAFIDVFAPSDVNSWAYWLFGAVFAIAAANIVSGGVAGRTRPRMYVLYMIAVSAVLYPIAAGLVWSGGLLADLGFHDFAGGMVIHGLGGLSGLTAAYVIGPRVDRYDADGSVNVIPGHSITLAVLGTLILAFGWYGFNVGTAVLVFSTGEGIALADFSYVGRVALNTSLGMVTGGIGAGLVAWRNTGKLDTLYLANGLLAGLVGVTPIADAAVWPGAAVVGLLAGAQLPVVFAFVEERLQIDDVCAVFPVHGTAGVLGILAFPFVATDAWAGGISPGFIADALVAQVAGVLLIGIISVAGTYALFRVGMAAGWARVDDDTEREGLDIGAHGVETYPEFGDVDAMTENPVPDGGRPASDIEMVVAYIRPDRLSEVKAGLAEVGAPSLSVSNVSGRGSQPAKQGQWRGEQYTVDLHQKVKVECVVADVPAQEVAEAIRDAAATGEKGDGKVFILPVSEALQIRTGRHGPEAV